MKTWILSVEDGNNGDYFITFPPDLLKESGWKVGDHIHWIDKGDGSYQLVKEDLTTFVKNGIINNGKN